MIGKKNIRQTICSRFCRINIVSFMYISSFLVHGLNIYSKNDWSPNHSFNNSSNYERKEESVTRNGIVYWTDTFTNCTSHRMRMN